MAINHIEQKSRLINYNKKASYLHLLNFVSQVGLYYYLKEEAKTKPEYEPYNIRINEFEYGLAGDWDGVANLADNAGANQNIGLAVQQNYGNLRERKVPKYKIPLSLVVASFSFMSFIAHTCLVILDNKYYTWITDYKVNFLRWIEYFISSPTMMLAIAGLVNINDSSLLNNILVSTAVTNIFGLMAEITKDDPKYGSLSKLFYLVGFLPFASSWSPIIDRFTKASNNLKGGADSIFAKGYKKIFGLTKYNNKFDQNFQIPDYVKYSVYGLLGLYFLFPLNMGYQQYLSKSEDSYYNGELRYITLSYISKAALSWIVFSGTFKPNDDYLSNKDFSLTGGTLIKPKYIYYGLAGLGATSLLTSYFNRDNNQPKKEEQEQEQEQEQKQKQKKEKTKLEYDDNDVYSLYIALEEEGVRIDDLSDKQIVKLIKKMKV
jgi:hypothetical protein